MSESKPSLLHSAAHFFLGWSQCDIFLKITLHSSTVLSSATGNSIKAPLGLLVCGSDLCYKYPVFVYALIKFQPRCWWPLVITGSLHWSRMYKKSLSLHLLTRKLTKYLLMKSTVYIAVIYDIVPSVSCPLDVSVFTGTTQIIFLAKEPISLILPN